MAEMNAQTLTREMSAGTYDADDLPNLARTIYVRCLFRVRNAGGRHEHAKSIAMTVTGNVLKQILGMHFTPRDVQELVDEKVGGKDAADAKPAEPAKPKVSLDPHDLGV